jgi:hypothetical protein
MMLLKAARPGGFQRFFGAYVTQATTDLRYALFRDITQRLMVD